MERDFKLAYFVLRAATGLDLFGHGFIRLAGNLTAFHSWITNQFAKTFLPHVLVSLTGYVIPPVELILGLLLMAGFKTRETLLAASALMGVLLFGSCVAQNWNVVAIQLFYFLVYSILIAFRAHNHWSLDSLRRFQQNRHHWHSGL